MTLHPFDADAHSYQDASERPSGPVIPAAAGAPLPIRITRLDVQIAESHNRDVGHPTEGVTPFEIHVQMQRAVAAHNMPRARILSKHLAQVIARRQRAAIRCSRRIG